jgi:tRNA pseudouridine32 synthase/23S rRNA pseudouridine746 synthase
MKILYADTHLVVVEKPGGLLSVPGRGPDKQDCVASRVRYLFAGCIAQPAVHRLDMHTSGIMVLALSQEAHRNLSRQFMDRSVTKKYIALVDGLVTQEGGKIELAFRLDPDNRPYQVYDPVYGKRGVSYWRKLENTGGKSRIEFTPISGRTHQLRLHASHKLGLGLPIVGDHLYGTGEEGGQMLLHASFLSFSHPADHQPLRFESVPPF